MKKIYLKHVQEQFDLQMANCFAEYQKYSLRLSKEQRKEATLFSGSLIYSRSVDKNTRLFIHMIPRKSQEGFLLEVGWSSDGNFPYKLTSVGLPNSDGMEYFKEEWLIDFGALYHKKYGKGFIAWDVWTPSVDVHHPKYLEIFVQEDLMPVTEEQAHDRAKKAVESCMSDIKDVVMPYFDEFIKTRIQFD